MEIFFVPLDKIDHEIHKLTGCMAPASILTKDFTILAWFSMISWARAKKFALELLNK